MTRERRKSDRRQGRAHNANERRGPDRRGSERRFDARLNLSIWVKQEHGKETVINRSVDLSPGGVQLDLGFPHPVGTRLRLRFALPNDAKEIVTEAEVVGAIWDDRPRAHLKFVNLAGEDFVRIQHYIDSLG